MKRTFLPLAFLVLLLASTVFAVPVYVDADYSNTTFNPTPGWFTTGSDGLWTIRTDYGLNDAYVAGGVGKDVFESDGATYEDSPLLTTSVYGLASGVYKVWVLWWGRPGLDAEWDISAGLSPTAMKNYTADSANTFTVTSLPSYSPQITVTTIDDSASNTGIVHPGSTNIVLYKTYLGKVAGTQIDVYVDDVFTMYNHYGEWLPLKDSNGKLHGGRTWYDGIMYELDESIQGTYVDATLSNTTPAEAIFSTDPIPEGYDTDRDNLWRLRLGEGFRGGALMESMGSIYEDSPVIATTESGLANQTYDVYLVYYARTEAIQTWSVQAGLNPSELTLHDKTTGIPTGTTYPGQETLKEYASYVGQVKSSSITLYVDDVVNQDRSWYEGFIYRPADPKLTIKSLNPDSGLTGITATADINNETSGTTPFSLTYIDGTTVTLTAPATNGTDPFSKWIINGVDNTANPATFSMDGPVVATAVYAAAPTEITVNGIVNLSDIAGQNPNYSYKATFKIYKDGNTDCGMPDVVKTADLDSNGNYSFTVEPLGTNCTIVVKAGTQTVQDPSVRYHFTAKKLTGADLSVSTTLNTVDLPNGDINDDNMIDAFDFTILMQAYDIVEDASLGQSDLTNDGFVDAFDFTILMLSYDSSGDTCN